MGLKRILSDGRRRRGGVLCLLSYFMAVAGAGYAQTTGTTAPADTLQETEIYTIVSADSAVENVVVADEAMTETADMETAVTLDTTAEAVKLKKKFNLAKIFSNTAGSADNPNFKPRKVAFVLGPGIYYTPSTSLAFTLGGQLFFDAMDKRLTHTDLPADKKALIGGRRSNLLIGLNASILKQFSLELDPELYFLDRRLMLKGSVYGGYWPSWFWGIGNDTPDGNKETYNELITTADLRLTYDVGHGVFLGLGGRYYFYYILSATEGLLTQTTVPGQDIAMGAGPMLSLIYDTRNDNTRPLKGALISFDALYNAPIRDFSGQYGKMTMDVRYYFHIPQPKQKIDHVIAVNLVASSTVGDDIPFQELPRMADKRYARGILKDRYIDQHMMAFQAEYRFYWKWLGFAVFGCVGDVGETLAEAWSCGKITYGVGLRLKPFTSLPFTIRGDMGFYKGKPQFYVGINELF